MYILFQGKVRLRQFPERTLRLEAGGPSVVSRSSNTFNLNFHFKINILRHYNAFSVQVTSKIYENEYLPFDL